MCPVGRNCTQEEREEFFEFDRVGGCGMLLFVHSCCSFADIAYLLLPLFVGSCSFTGNVCLLVLFVCWHCLLVVFVYWYCLLALFTGTVCLLVLITGTVCLLALFTGTVCLLALFTGTVCLLALFVSMVNFTNCLLVHTV